MRQKNSNFELIGGGPRIGVYCPNCSNFDYFSGFVKDLFTGKKPRFCRKCGNENIVVNFADLEIPNEIKETYLSRKLFAFGIWFLAIIILLVPLLTYWTWVRILPDEEIPFFLDRINAFFFITIILFMYLTTVSVLFMILMNLYVYEPQEQEERAFYFKVIQRCLPDELAYLPSFEEINDPIAARWVVSPRGLKYLKVEDNLSDLETDLQPSINNFALRKIPFE